MSIFGGLESVLRQAAPPQPRRSQRTSMGVDEHLGVLDDDLDEVWRGMEAFYRTLQNTNRLIFGILSVLIMLLIAIVIDLALRLQDAGMAEVVTTSAGS